MVEPPRPLTPRELEVVRLVVEGKDNPAIAADLFLSPRTVQSHVSAALRKLDAGSRTSLAVEALRRGLVPLHPDEGSEPPPDDGGSPDG